MPTYSSLGSLDAALDNMEEAVDNLLLAKENTSSEEHPYLYSRICTLIADYYQQLGPLTKAEENIVESISMKEEINYIITLSKSYSILGSIRIEQNRLKEAQEIVPIKSSWH